MGVLESRTGRRTVIQPSKKGLADSQLVSPCTCRAAKALCGCHHFRPGPGVSDRKWNYKPGIKLALVSQAIKLLGRRCLALEFLSLAHFFP